MYIMWFVMFVIKLHLDVGPTLFQSCASISDLILYCCYQDKDLINKGLIVYTKGIHYIGFLIQLHEILSCIIYNFINSFYCLFVLDNLRSYPAISYKLAFSLHVGIIVDTVFT